MKTWKRYLAALLVTVLTVGMTSTAFPKQTETVMAADTETTQTLPLDLYAKWRYLEDGTDPAGDSTAEDYNRTCWTLAEFDDSSWKESEDGVEAKFGAKKGVIGSLGTDSDGNDITPTILLNHYYEGTSTTIPTYFFRTTFTIENVSEIGYLVGTLLYDDAAIIYINGTKVTSFDEPTDGFDTNLSYGGSNATAPKTVSFNVPAETLVEGENILAIEIHNSTKSSSDVYFELTSLEVAEVEIVQKAISMTVGSDETERNLTWYANVPGTGKVQYAMKMGDAFPEEYNEVSTTGVASKDTENGAFYSYKAILSVEPNTEYVYRLVNGETVSETYDFTTGAEGDFSFLFVGDPQIGASSTDADTESWANTLNVATTAFPDYSFLLSAGDQVNTASNEEQYAGFLGNDYMTSLATATVIGNHDTGGAAYSEHFNNPNVSEYGTTTAGSDYWFVYNNVLFMCLNSNSTGTDSVAEHKALMEEAIAANPDVDWKIVVFHHSIFSAASHATNSDIISRRTAYVPIFTELDVDVVLMGHDHIYVRTYMMDMLTPVTTDEVEYSVTNPEDEILYVTVNSSTGSKYYDMQSAEYEYAAVKNQEYAPNFSNVQITEDSFKITTYRVNDMSVVDEFAIYREEVDEERIVDSYTVEEAAQYIGKEAPECEEDGFLFAGWYGDSACTTMPLENLDEVTGTVYALFVPSDILNVKAQISSNLGNSVDTDDGTASIRFVTTVDSLNYRQVGFDVSYDRDGDGISNTYTRVSNKVYRSLYAVSATAGDVMQYLPTVFHNQSVYFKACTVTGVTADYYNLEFTVTPFWYTADGVRVDGITVVRTINDGVHSDAEAKLDGSYYEELEDAIEDANAKEEAKVILLNDAEVESQMTISSNVTIQNKTGEDITIYRGSGLAATNMFCVESDATLTILGTDDAESLVLDGRTVETAMTTDLDTLATTTASLITTEGILSVDHATIQYVKGKVQGAAIYNTGTLVVKESVMDSNYTTGGDSVGRGGAIYSTGDVTITDTTFTNNRGYQGATIASYYGTLTLVGTEGNLEKAIFEENISSYNGGGIRSWGGTVNITNYAFSDNHATGSKGGALYADNKAVVNIKDSKFTGNSSVENGGAVGVGGSVSLTLTGTTDRAVFDSNYARNTDTSNDADRGGAIYAGSGTCSIFGYTFRSNYAEHYGGGLYAGATTTLEDCIFASNISDSNGGAAHLAASSTVKNCKFTNNLSALNGGAIFSRYAATTITITGTDEDVAVFAYNVSNAQKTAATGDTSLWGGGAVCASAGVLSVTGYTFTSNSARYSDGGAINFRGTTLTVDDCDFISNTVTKKSSSYDAYGGAIFMNAGTLYLGQNAGCYFNGNKGTNGGAIYFLDGTSYLYDSNFMSNTASWNGGALYLASAATVTVSNNDFTSNTASGRGGAICNEGGTIYVSDSDFISNTAGYEGGAFRMASSGTATFTNGKFENNTANCNGSETGRGGGAVKFNTGTLTIEGYTFSGNTATGGDTYGHDIKMNTTSTLPTLTNCTFNESNVRDSAGTAAAYTDGGGNTLVTDEE